MAQSNEIVIGITVTTTGPAAALGIPERNALDFVVKEIGGVPLKVIVLDDGGDPTAATTNARRFVTESKADVIMGSSTTPPTVAVSTVANEAGIPHFSLAPFPITPERAKWSVAMPQPVPLMGKGLYEHMKAHNIKTVGYIGYSDSYGDLWINDLKTQGVPLGLTIVAEERYARPDTSVTGQALKLIAANPDAILVGGSGTAAALPQTELRAKGYKGLIYHNHGAASMDFIRIAGPAAEGVIMASGPVMNPEGQPDSALTKKPGPCAQHRLRSQIRRQQPQPVRRPLLRCVQDSRTRRAGGVEDGQAGNAGIPRSDPSGLDDREGTGGQPGRLQLHRKGSLRPRRPRPHHPDGEGREIRSGEVDARRQRCVMAQSLSRPSTSWPQK